MNLTVQQDPAASPLQDDIRRIEEFLATLAHEMRNPLSALSNALDVWEHAPGEQRQIVELRHLMKRQVAQLVRFSEDLLDAERIAQGKLAMRQTQVDLRQPITGACEQLGPFIDRCGHALEVRLPPVPLMVYGDPSRLLQVFANLLQNAAKFTGRNGRLSVTAESAGGIAVVGVRDNGPGIEERKLSTIFQRYVQLHGPIAMANDGLGIGLGLVKAIVEQHHGSLAARSAGRGQGSEFTVQLPLSREVRDDLASDGAVLFCQPHHLQYD